MSSKQIETLQTWIEYAQGFTGDQITLRVDYSMENNNWHAWIHGEGISDVVTLESDWERKMDVTSPNLEGALFDLAHLAAIDLDARSKRGPGR